METVPSLTFHDGGKIPQIGMGCYAINKQGITNAIKLGYRHIDGAHYYKTQSIVGQALKQSKIPREQFFITSKVWTSHMTRQKAEESLATSLKDLQTDYVDLLLIHWPYVDDVDREDGQKLKKHRIQVWKTLIDFKKQGKAKHIGVSNFLPKHIDQLIEATNQVPVVNQILNHPYKVLTDVIEYCKSKNILIEGWSPLAAGKFNLLEDETLNEIAKKHNRTAAEVVLRWDVQKGYIVFPKSNSQNRAEDNITVFDFKLSEEEIKKIDELHKTVEIDTDNIKNMFVA